MESDSLPGWASRLVEPDRQEARWLPYRTYRDTWLRVAAVVARARRGALEPGSAAAFAPSPPSAESAASTLSTPIIEARAWGVSHGGQPIWSIAVEPAEGATRTTLVVAGLHAMEHVGVATAVALLERAAATPWRDHRLIVVPMGNPDGFLAVEDGLARGQRRFRRSNAAGVDLNRNFAVGWDDRYYLHRWLPRIFAPGSRPLSEPETRAIDDLLSSSHPAHAISLHAFGEWIFTPYAGSRRPPRDSDRLIEIARAMAAVQERPYRVIQLGRRSRLFQARGAEIDHFYERHGALSFLFEIGAGPRLRAPSTWLHPYRWFTPPAPLLERDVANVLPAIESLADL